MRMCCLMIFFPSDFMLQNLAHFFLINIAFLELNFSLPRTE